MCLRQTRQRTRDARLRLRSNINSQGDGFNAAGGGIYATEWTSNGISIWFFPRNGIPADLVSGTPSPTGWRLSRDLLEHAIGMKE